MTERLHLDDPNLLEFDATVVARREHQGRPAVVLDRTAFYAESGGQPWDTGTLSGVRVVAVIEHEGEVLHVLEGPLPGERVSGRVDAQRRRDHSQQHHGQHLLSRAFVELAAARTVSFHLGTEDSTIDLDREVTEAQVRAAEARANEVVREARPVATRVVTRAEASALGIAAPPDAGDAVRLVEAERFDLQPCGGTHPRRTSEVGAVVVDAHERYKGGTRVRFLCGERARAAFHARSGVLRRLSSLFSAGPDALVEAAGRALSQLEASARRERDLMDRALEGEARRLLSAAAGSPAVVVAVYADWPPADLRTLAQKITALAPSVALLGSREDGKAHVVFAQSAGLGHDVPGLLREAVALLGGRGGGRADLAQGGGDDASRLEAALEGAAARVRAPRAGA